jgi:hypothetical protein
LLALDDPLARSLNDAFREDDADVYRRSALRLEVGRPLVARAWTPARARLLRAVFGPLMPDGCTATRLALSDRWLVAETLDGALWGHPREAVWARPAIASLDLGVRGLYQIGSRHVLLIPFSPWCPLRRALDATLLVSSV